MSRPLQPSGFFVLRTPLLPFDELLGWTAAPDPARHLAALLARPAVLEAVYLASPSLAEALADPDSPRGQKAVPGLASYFTRMCSRVAPFGLFAGLSVGHLGGATCFDVPAADGFQRVTRLDMGYLSLLIEALERDQRVRHLVNWWPNTSLYNAAGRLHLAAVHTAGSGRSYNLVAVDETKALMATLERAGDGATVDALAATLVDGGASPAQAEQFVSQLIDAQLLVSDLGMRVTGDEPIDPLISALRLHPYTAAAARCLDGVRTALQEMDAKGPGASPDQYRRVQELLRELPVETDPGRLFQVDMLKPGPSPSLGPGPLAEIVRAIDILHRLAPPPRADDPLTQFRDAFVERYEDRSMPLLATLDPQVGIGFGVDPSHDQAPLLEGLELSSARNADSAFGAREAVLLRMLGNALEAGRHEISLDAVDLDALASPAPAPLPDTLEVVAVVAAQSAEAVDQGDFRVLIKGVLGPPGVALLGRFCHADADLHRRVREHVRAEESCRPDAVFAEIVHLPEGRVGNILCRPVLRSFEIPYLGRSGAVADAQIPLGDLWVSVVEGRVVLRSRRLDREVIPRLTTPHDFGSGSLAAYHFLCALQDQATAARLGWDWGPLYGAPFLPRVTSGRLVLARAQWNLPAAELAELSDRRAAGRLPRFVALVDGDNDLATDLDNPMSVDALRRHTADRHRRSGHAGRPSVMLVELFPQPDDLCAVGPNGRFMHDLVVPFVRAPAPTPAPVAPRPAGRRPMVQRSFPPGSEWFYAKLYTGTATADRVLVDLVRPMVDEAMRRGVADSWFFIRYADPHWHLRVRLHGDAAAILPLLDEAGAPLLADGRLWRVQLDTYEREIERYGGDDGIALSERFFHYDSEAVLALVQRFWGDASQDARWRLALLGIDMLLSDLGFGLPDKEAWAKRQRQAYADEFRVTGRLRGQLGDVYRTQRQSLSALLERGEDPGHPLASGAEILRYRSGRVRPLQQEITKRGLDTSDLASSYAHMYVNRLLRSAHRAQELVIYDLLHRLYVSRIAVSQQA